MDMTIGIIFLGLGILLIVFSIVGFLAFIVAKVIGLTIGSIGVVFGIGMLCVFIFFVVLFRSNIGEFHNG